MANTFQIPLINPFRFVNANYYDTVDPRYENLPFDYVKDGFMNPNSFYAQPWKISDYTKFQFQSDFAGATFKFYRFSDDTFVKSFAIDLKNVSIKNVTWSVYECTVTFADLDEGVYYGVLSYTDQDEVVQNLQTSPLDVRQRWPKTILYEYKHTFNDKGVIWDTGILMSVRVQGLIREFDPASQRDDYVDQEYDAYVLNDVPYRTFTNFIGSAKGLPNWVVDKMNIVYTVNSLRLDGQYYTKKSGETIKMTRPEYGDNENGFASIKIIQNENFNLAQYQTGETPNTDEFVVIAEQIPYYNNAANIAISGVFKLHSTLLALAIIVKDDVPAPFTIKIGTTNGGAELYQIDLTAEITQYIELGKVFNGATDVFITGLGGHLLDINVRYDYYDAPVQNSGDNTGGFVENVEYTYYEYTVGDFVRDWNPATGWGNAGTNFEGCHILDGNDGTINDAGLFRMGWNKTLPATRQTVQGNANNEVTIPKAALPAVGLPMFTVDVNPTNGDIVTPTSNVARARSTSGPGTRLDYEMVKGNIVNVPTLGLSGKMGSGDPLDITPNCLVCVRFIKPPIMV